MYEAQLKELSHMTSKSTPPVLKPALPYLKHAEQLDSAAGQQAPMMAYFCRAYAMDLGIKVGGPTPCVFLGV